MAAPEATDVAGATPASAAAEESPLPALFLPPTTPTMAHLTEQHRRSCQKVSDARAAVHTAGVEGGRLLPALAHAIEGHVAELRALRGAVAAVAARAARCRARALALAERHGVDVASLGLNDPDAEIE